MSYKIGPKELYVPMLDEHAKIVKQDNDESVIWYKKNHLDYPDLHENQIALARKTQGYYSKSKTQCANGDLPEENFLIYTSRYKCDKVLKFIVEHIDNPKTLNLLDSTFRQTAVSSAVMILHKKTVTPNSEYQTVCEKAFACTKMLLEAGANPNTFLNDETLIEGDFSHQNLVPSVAASVLMNWTAMMEENKKDLSDENYKQNCLTYTHYLEKTFLLLFQHGASITLCHRDNTRFKNGQPNEEDITHVRKISLHSVVEESDTSFIKETLPKCVELMKLTNFHACWEKCRLLYLGSRSASSPFANNPGEINFLILTQFADLPNYENKAS